MVQKHKKRAQTSAINYLFSCIDFPAKKKLETKHIFRLGFSLLLPAYINSSLNAQAQAKYRTNYLFYNVLIELTVNKIAVLILSALTLVNQRY